MHILTETEKEFLREQGWSEERIADFKNFCDETDLEEEDKGPGFAAFGHETDHFQCIDDDDDDDEFESIKHFKFKSKGIVCFLDFQKNLQTGEYSADLEYTQPDGTGYGTTVFFNTTYKKKAYGKFMDILKMDKKKPMHLVPQI